MAALINNGCNSSSNKQDESSDFYSSSENGDLFRIPLLDPIELKSADEANWFLKPMFNGINETNEEVGDINEVAVAGSIIICYSERTYRDSEMGPAWYIIDVENKSEKCLTNLNDYLFFLQENSTQNIKLKDVNEVYSEFVDSKTLLKDN